MNSRKIIFIIGGARSGKSSFALKEASRFSGRKAYIATAEPLDEEMRDRIEAHKEQRGKDWDTYEEPLKISGLIKKIEDSYRTIVVDCLTLWLSNVLLSGLEITNAIDHLRKVLAGAKCCLSRKQITGLLSDRATGHVIPSIYLISNEVGMGIVPENEAARRFSDMAGTLNQEIADIADEVYVVVAGIPLKIKEKGHA